MNVFKPSSRCGKAACWLGLIIFLQFSNAVSASNVSTGFNSVFISSDVVNAITLRQDEGNLLIGGKFTISKPFESNPFIFVEVGRNMIQLSSDGDLVEDTSYAFNGEVFALAEQNNGKVLVGGSFTEAQGHPRVNLARLNIDGSTDTGFNISVDGLVRTIAVQNDGKVLIGGDFINVGGVERRYLARLNADGSLDAGFNAVLDDRVMSISLQPDGKVITGGLFQTINGVPRERFARLNPNGSLDTGFARLIFNDEVSAIALQVDGGVLVGGFFDNINGAQHNGLVRLTAKGRIDSGFNTSLNPGSIVTALAVQSDGKILLGGGAIITQSGVSRVARLLADGAPDLSYDADASGTVSAIAIQGSGEALIGGKFSQLNGTVGAALGRLRTGGTVDRGRISSSPNNTVNAVATQADGKTLIGGIFTDVGGQAVSRLARYKQDGSLDTTFTAGTNGAVNAISVQANDQILVGGKFTSVSGAAFSRLARINHNGTVDGSFTPNFRYPTFIGIAEVKSIALQPDKKIVVGGFFEEVNGLARNNIVRLDTSGNVDSNFNADVNSWVNAIATQPDGKIVIGGDFTTVNGQSRTKLARLNPDGSLDMSFNPILNNGSAINFGVDSIVLMPDGRMLVGGRINRSIEIVNADGSLDRDFDSVSGDSVRSIALSANGEFIVTGEIAYFSDEINDSVRGLAMFNADESLNSDFFRGFNAQEEIGLSLSMQSSGRTTIGGSFDEIGAVVTPNLGIISNDRAALQEVTLSEIDGSYRLEWLRGGGAPEINHSTLELSTSRQSYSPPVLGQRVDGGWRFDDLDIASGEIVSARFRGYYGDGKSSSVTETKQQLFIVVDDEELCAVIKAKNNNVIVFCL